MSLLNKAIWPTSHLSRPAKGSNLQMSSEMVVNILVISPLSGLQRVPSWKNLSVASVSFVLTSAVVSFILTFAVKSGEVLTKDEHLANWTYPIHPPTGPQDQPRNIFLAHSQVPISYCSHSRNISKLVIYVSKSMSNRWISLNSKSISRLAEGVSANCSLEFGMGNLNFTFRPSLQHLLALLWY